MSNAHAQAVIERQEGAVRAIEDFKSGVTENPFSVGQGWRLWAWDEKMKQLVCRRDHGAICCQEHSQHLAGRWNKSHMGLTSCSYCEKEVDEERQRLIKEQR